MQFKLNKMDELEANQIQIINQKIDKLYELFERTNQVQQNDSKSNNDKVEKLFELAHNQQNKFEGII
jgi:hypothetical protein